MRGWVIVRTQEVLTSDDATEAKIRAIIDEHGQVATGHELPGGIATVVIVRDELSIEPADVAFHRGAGEASDVTVSTPLDRRPTSRSTAAPASPRDLRDLRDLRKPEQRAPAAGVGGRTRKGRQAEPHGLVTPGEAAGAPLCLACGEPIIRASGQRGRLPVRHPGCLPPAKAKRLATQRNYRARTALPAKRPTSTAERAVPKAAVVPPTTSRAVLAPNTALLARCAGCDAELRSGQPVVLANVYVGGAWNRIEKWEPDCYAAAGSPHGAVDLAGKHRRPGQKEVAETQRTCARDGCGATWARTTANRQQRFCRSPECDAARKAERDGQLKLRPLGGAAA